MTGRWGRRAVALVAVVGACLGTLAVDSSYGATARVTSAVTKSKAVERDFLDNGTLTVADKRTVSVSVSTTKGLQSLQQIHVSWSGAHPTGGVAKDINSPAGASEEYSFDLFECRGVDSTSVAASKRLSPETCWTGYANERFTDLATFNPVWRADLYASSADRTSVAGDVPKTLTPQCSNILLGARSQRWLSFVGADGTSYYGGPDGCQGLAPQASPENLSTSALPSNETFGVTGADGSGSADFVMFTSEDNAALGCSATVACSLVAVPIEGLSCDPNGSQSGGTDAPSPSAVVTVTAACEATGNLKPGQVLGSSGTAPADAVTGNYWWSASNWRNRISFPLTVAPSLPSCGLTSAKPVLQAYGSELLTQATGSWSAHFCLDSPFGFTHVQLPEAQARSLLTSGQADVALTTQNLGDAASEPTALAPVAVSGFAIAVDIDDAAGQPLDSVKLDARLLAKLLTMSYPAQQIVKSVDPALAGNPLNMSVDPEFTALNPGIGASEANSAATLLSLNTDNDVVHALTAYINADPDARSWLNGTPDPWGMTVNPVYKGIALPVDSWPLLDTFEPLDAYQIGLNDCLAVDPVPYLPLVASPISRLSLIAQDMEFSLSQSQTTCQIGSPIPGQTAGDKLVADGRETIGQRFMLGVVDVADADRYGLSVASLESAATAAAPAKFTSGAGRTFIAPTAAGMRAAVAAAVPDTSTGTWTLDPTTLRSSAPNAYPGTMIVYAATPTKGLASSDASEVAGFLRYVAGAGQVQGLSPGQLPPGYLPLTSSTGAGALAGYTDRVASAVAAQSGVVPSLLAGSTPSGSGAAAGGSTGSAGSNTSTGATSPASPSSAPPASSTLRAPNTRTPAVASVPSVAGSAGVTAALSTGLAGSVLPLLLLLGLAGGLVSVILGLRRRPATR